MPACQGADEQIAAPLGKGIARVELHAGRSDRRYPVHDGLLHARPRGLLRDDRPRVIDAIRDRRPAVVGAGAHPVHFITAPGTVLVHPYLARVRLQRESLHVPMAVRIDLRQRTGPAHEGIVRGNRSVIVEAHDFAEVGIEPLGLIAMIESIADRRVELAVRPEQQAAAEVVGLSLPRLRREDPTHVSESLSVEAPAHDR